MGDVAIVVGLVAACAVALVLILLARRDATITRSRADRDVSAVRDETRTLLADAQQREVRVGEREQALAAAELALADDRRALAQERDAAVAARDEAERAAEVAHTVLDAARQEAATSVAQAAGVAAEAERTALERLEATAGLSADEARTELVRQLTAQAANEAAAAVRRVEAKTRRTADAKARRIVATAVHRTAVATSAQAATTVLPLPSEEMKGRIIGKEGRNIRAFEALTGVNLVIGDVPDAVVLSCFDAGRREIAVVTLEALMTDGRINPPRIEAAYAEALAGGPERADAAGHDAAERAGVRELAPQLVRILGELRLRTSYGQNVLEHLVETALLAAAIAAEVGADVTITRRAALLHDLGKALTPETPGTHAALGADLARRYGEVEEVAHAIAAHHDEVAPETVEAVLVQVADAISAARPGARRDDGDQYVDRMSDLERLVAGQPGVRRALVMAAGREVRVVVEPSQVPDEALGRLAVDIARAIESAPGHTGGEVKVTAVREVRASATAG